MAEGSHGVVRRIGLVEDHESVALGFAAMLADQPDLELAGTATTVSGLLEQVTDRDLAVLDLRLSDGSSPKSNVEQLRAAGLETLVFTGAENPYLLRSAARAGVLGVVRKSEPAAVVIEAIRVAAAGGQVASTEWAAAIDGDPELDDVGLSPRPLEVLELYASGEKLDRVARLTGLAPQTVNDYLQRIRQKYAEAGRPAPTKTDLYKRAVEDGWLPMPERSDVRRR
ncbi:MULTISPECIES: response regulator transcription factor [Rhodococcus]|uniref:response regulator transcription factor n=1 Tax=Rhodococcus TaxID=1827 RepID=UPI001E3D0B42|nr:response regulator transcription factor [Rhodococcus pyridinivorans]MCD2116058.1 response regulator transcription factor [Rhodococcus pyridinivorans]MCZ4624922.1 response regulator transcription factor [Rhodococcus pyridinivorans]MCZ4646132.1 response regulator transcription factor [Rhodococcus pyridinivorans]MDJ0484005.1 response regulator transcription factor [Rhodococcus pyridinivorans]MDV7251913.1 response regulator transcription factor [Rhodococcus pyridinivorans]